MEQGIQNDLHENYIQSSGAFQRRSDAPNGKRHMVSGIREVFMLGMMFAIAIIAIATVGMTIGAMLIVQRMLESGQGRNTLSNQELELYRAASQSL
jgi:hypothetical protein